MILDNNYRLPLQRRGLGRGLLLLIFPTVLFAQEKDTVAIRYSQSVTAADMSKNLHVLASDEYEGRETGKKGQKMWVLTKKMVNLALHYRPYVIF